MITEPMESDTVALEASSQFIATPYIQEMTERAITYLNAGYAVHFAGPAGTGKTTLAFHVAAKRGRPITLLHGDHEFSSSDLVGSENGYHKHTLVDNYIHSVVKTEEQMRRLWVDNRLTTACRDGGTLIYDEFTRSRPEANNALLSVLSEQVLNLPGRSISGENYLRVHSDFRAILTSNPEEYVGTHKTQDALIDRLITIEVGPCDRETEVQVTRARSGVGRDDAETLVDIARELRRAGKGKHWPTTRACIAIGRVLVCRNAQARWNDPVFQRACRDVFNPNGAKVTQNGKAVVPQKADRIIRQICELHGNRYQDAGQTA